MSDRLDELDPTGMFRRIMDAVPRDVRVAYFNSELAAARYVLTAAIDEEVWQSDDYTGESEHPETMVKFISILSAGPSDTTNDFMATMLKDAEAAVDRTRRLIANVERQRQAD